MTKTQIFRLICNKRFLAFENFEETKHLGPSCKDGAFCVALSYPESSDSHLRPFTSVTFWLCTVKIAMDCEVPFQTPSPHSFVPPPTQFFVIHFASRVFGAIIHPKWRLWSELISSLCHVDDGPRSPLKKSFSYRSTLFEEFQENRSPRSSSFPSLRGHRYDTSFGAIYTKINPNSPINHSRHILSECQSAGHLARVLTAAAAAFALLPLAGAGARGRRLPGPWASAKPQTIKTVMRRVRRGGGRSVAMDGGWERSE